MPALSRGCWSPDPPAAFPPHPRQPRGPQVCAHTWARSGAQPRLSGALVYVGGRTLGGLSTSSNSSGSRAVLGQVWRNQPTARTVLSRSVEKISYPEPRKTTWKVTSPPQGSPDQSEARLEVHAASSSFFFTSFPFKKISWACGGSMFGLAFVLAELVHLF